MDVNANNYNVEAEVDNGTCTYPSITFNLNGNNLSGNVEGAGGSFTDFYSWTNTSGSADYSMTYSGQSGEFKITVSDSNGTPVWSGLMNENSNSFSQNGSTASGTSGVWNVSVELTNFSGTGNFSLTQ